MIVVAVATTKEQAVAFEALLLSNRSFRAVDQLTAAAAAVALAELLALSFSPS